MDAVGLALIAVLGLVLVVALRPRRASFRAAPVFYDRPRVYPLYTARPLLAFDPAGRCAAWCSQRPCTVWCR
ncbi:MAG TPA: hypothetical protein VNI01_07275 [Elusimicrobiota bacterium]|jgi:hypothetical protein|nr:hypothetical protein [Elusimicrobiota bacterium]